jgi:hypothetical protein
MQFLSVLHGLFILIRTVIHAVVDIFKTETRHTVLPFLENSLYCIHTFTYVFEVNMIFEPHF